MISCRQKRFQITKDKLSINMAHIDKPMQGKICLVTGAASGIGAVTARTLAQQGAAVVLVDRNAEGGMAMVDQIKQRTGDSAVEFMRADLSSQKEICQLAQQFTNRYQRLDVLVNNAGALFPQRRETIDGLEMTFALNYLGYFRLTNLLLARLKASAPARIVNVASRTHALAQINFDDLQSRSGYRGRQAYAHSKLAIVLFTYELARRLQGTGVTVNVVDPGTVATNFPMNNGKLIGLAVRLFSFALPSPEEGAQTSIYLATSPEVEGVSGKYFVKCKAVPSSPASYDTATASRLWQVSETYLDGTF